MKTTRNSAVKKSKSERLNEAEDAIDALNRDLARAIVAIDRLANAVDLKKDVWRRSTKEKRT